MPVPVLALDPEQNQYFPIIFLTNNSSENRRFVPPLKIFNTITRKLWQMESEAFKSNCYSKTSALNTSKTSQILITLMLWPIVERFKAVIMGIWEVQVYHAIAVSCFIVGSCGNVAIVGLMLTFGKTG